MREEEFGICLKHPNDNEALRGPNIGLNAVEAKVVDLLTRFHVPPF